MSSLFLQCLVSQQTLSVADESLEVDLAMVFDRVHPYEEVAYEVFKMEDI